MKLRFRSLLLATGTSFLLFACSGGAQAPAPTATNPGGDSNLGAAKVTGTAPTPTTPDGTKTIATVPKGKRTKPNKVSNAADFQPFHYYDLSGFQVCSTGTSAKDQVKMTLFINLAGPSETCPSDPKKTFTVISRMIAIKNKGLTITKGMHVDKGVVFPQKDLGNDRLVAFITEDIFSGQFKFKP